MEKPAIAACGQGQPAFQLRVCRHCRRRFSPAYANQQMHPECVREWRRRYQKLYQRKVRQELREEDAAYLLAQSEVPP